MCIRDSDYSGAEIMRVLRDEVRNLGVEVVEFSPVVELVKDTDGKVAGAILFKDVYKRQLSRLWRMYSFLSSRSY